MITVSTSVRLLELGFALASSYMTSVTLLQTSLYAKIRPLFIRFGGPIIEVLRIDVAYFDLIFPIMALMLSILFWRRGDVVGFGRLFMLNMLLFFPAVIDFSNFNWVSLILSYEMEPGVLPIWVFGVGLLLQLTYVVLSYTVKFRGLREEMKIRGAEIDDVNQISRGQMFYLGQLATGTLAVTIAIYYSIPFLKKMINFDAAVIPYPHIFIGVTCTIMIAIATLMFIKKQDTPILEVEEEMTADDGQQLSHSP
jgi:hypothetical protein